MNCKAQSTSIQDISAEKNLKYVLATIEKVDYLNHSLYDRSFFVSVYTMRDSKASTEGHFEGSDEVLSSILVSILPDGDYYTDSKLYKLEGISNPKVLGIEETDFPEFELSIEQGKESDRKVVKYKFAFKE